MASVSVDPARLKRQQVMLRTRARRDQLKDFGGDLETHRIDDRQPVFLLEMGYELLLVDNAEAHEMRSEDPPCFSCSVVAGQLILGDQRPLEEEFAEAGHQRD